ncbi:hypothetical protein NDU88_001711 [Pleurodeles waltl]|uniref:Uncharacterized protein n=1 Tax=Pleurodeles waltl TaxID=8319 RepID=A0AAV7LYE6_PLEWA|nr:hypothetical protein NDU88_001711 [Pleurodeles waltl]
MGRWLRREDKEQGLGVGGLFGRCHTQWAFCFCESVLGRRLFAREGVCLRSYWVEFRLILIILFEFVTMEPSKVVMALKVLQDEGREDLIKEGVLEEAWVGLRRPKRRSAEGVSAAACSSPKSGKKFLRKSVEGRKVRHSPDLGSDTNTSLLSVSASRSRGRRGGYLPRRRGSSFVRRISSGGRSALTRPAVASAGRMVAKGKGAQVQVSARLQAQSPVERGAEQDSRKDEERTLAGARKMAAPRKKFQSMPVIIKTVVGKPDVPVNAGSQLINEVVVIIDSEEELQEADRRIIDPVLGGTRVSHGSIKNRLIHWTPRLVSPMIHKVQSWEINNQDAFQLGEQVELVDDSGAVFKGIVCSEAGISGMLDKVYVGLDSRQLVNEGTSGCDTSHVSGEHGVQAIYRQSGRIVGDKSLLVKVRAPSKHRPEGRVRSGAVHPTSRDAEVSVAAQPSTSQSAGDDWAGLDEELLDYEEVEVPVMSKKRVVVADEEPLVVQGGHVPVHRQERTAGSLPRGEEGGVHGGGDISGKLSRANVSNVARGSKELQNKVDAAIQVSAVTETEGKKEVSGGNVDKSLEKDEAGVGGCVGGPDKNVRVLTFRRRQLLRSLWYGWTLGHVAAINTYSTISTAWTLAFLFTTPPHNIAGRQVQAQPASEKADVPRAQL